MSERLTKTVLFAGRRYARFIPYPQEITDDTVRCFFCGQIDEPEVHIMSACPAGRAALTPSPDAGAATSLLNENRTLIVETAFQAATPIDAGKVRR